VNLEKQPAESRSIVDEIYKFGLIPKHRITTFPFPSKRNGRETLKYELPGSTIMSEMLIKSKAEQAMRCSETGM
jgi:hypothetical protein